MFVFPKKAGPFRPCCVAPSCRKVGQTPKWQVPFWCKMKNCQKVCPQKSTHTHTKWNPGKMERRTKTCGHGFFWWLHFLTPPPFPRLFAAPLHGEVALSQVLLAANWGPGSNEGRDPSPTKVAIRSLQARWGRGGCPLLSLGDPG